MTSADQPPAGERSAGQTPAGTNPGSAQTATGWTPPASRRIERDGRSPLERYAVARLRADVAAMPASEIVQLVLWPHTVADWARDAQVAPAVVYNLLSRFKPYRRVRELLALRLEVPVQVLDHLVDAPRPLPSALRAPAAVDHADLRAAPATPPAPPPPADDWRRAGGVLSSVRDGSNPLELRAVYQCWQDTAALPASLLVQLALFPETLAQWARRRRVAPSLLYGVLAGTQRQPGMREALARQLGLPTAAIDHAIDAPRAEPSRPATMPLADAPRKRDGEEAEPESDRPEPQDGLSSPAASGDLAQLSLGL